MTLRCRPSATRTPVRSAYGGRHDDRLATVALRVRVAERRRSAHCRPRPAYLLAHGAWVDHLPGWLGGADQLFAALVDRVPWKAERRQMYDRVVDVPRLLKFYGEDEPLPDPLLAEARHRLDEHYARRARRAVPHERALLLPRRPGQRRLARRPHRPRPHRGHDGRDPVARRAADAAAAPARRRRGPPARFPLGHGDLLVMGGSCQRTWEHAVPKSARPVGPRISVQFRPARCCEVAVSHGMQPV